MKFKHLHTYDLPDLKDETTPNGRWYYTPNGDKYPSVTTVIGSKEKPQLKNWRLMLGDTKAKKEMNRCAERGTAVHLMTENYLNNNPDPTKGHLDEHVRLFNQLKIRLNAINNIFVQEQALYSDVLKLAGRVDCIGEYNHELSIIDFKTSNNSKTHEMVDEYKLQCTAYSLMFEELTGYRINNMVILMTVEKGMVPLVFQDKTEKYVQPLLDRIKYYRNKNK